MDAPIISFKWNNSEDFLFLTSHSLELNIGSKSQVVSLSELVSIKLDTKKKLAPLIIGVVLASLALVNILLEGAGLSMIGFLSIGMLILYFGITEYWVITLEKFQSSHSNWIPKNKCPVFPKTFVNIIEYKVSKGFFPPFYTRIERDNLPIFVSGSEVINKLNTSFKVYLTPPKQERDNLLVKIDIEKIKQTLIYEVDSPYLAIGEYQLNKEAILNIEL